MSNEVKHTPGPWEVDTTVALGAYGVWTEYATHPGHDGAGYPTQICSLCVDGWLKGNKEQRNANARLIAAAPDLLEALVQTDRELVNLLPHIPQSCYPGHEIFIDSHVDVCFQIIRTAIAKATGKE